MEQELPATLTAKAVKRAVPEKATLTKDARQMLNSATSMFTLYLASIAQENAAQSKRQTISLKDVMAALRDVDFDHFIPAIDTCIKETKDAAAAKRLKKKDAAAEAEQIDDLNNNEEDVAMSSAEEKQDSGEESAVVDTDEQDTEETIMDEALEDHVE